MVVFVVQERNQNEGGDMRSNDEVSQRMIDEIAVLKKELDEANYWRHNYADAVKVVQKELANEKDAHELCHGLRLVLAKDLEIARAESFERGQRLESLQMELDKLKSLERQRWKSARQAFGAPTITPEEF